MSFKCEECDKTFSKRSHYERHRVTHTQVRSFKCPQCDKYFKRRDHMTRHKNMVHSDEARKFKCPFEGCLSSGFIDNYHLKRHIKSVHELNFVCEICEERNKLLDPLQQVEKFRFKKKSQLAKHMTQMHQVSSNFKCQYCSKTFVKKKQFDLHIQRHEEKIQKKNKQILDLSEKKQKLNQEAAPPKSEAPPSVKTENKEEVKDLQEPKEQKETSFEDDTLKQGIELLQKKVSSPFMLAFRKRFKSSDSEGSIYKYNFPRPSSFKLDSPVLQCKKSEQETLFNDSSVREFFEKKENALSKSPKRDARFICPESGCHRDFSTAYNLKTHVKTVHLKIREFKCKLCQNEYLHKKNLIEHIKHDHPGIAHSSDDESAHYNFPHYGLNSQKESSNSDQGNVSPIYTQCFQPLSQPKSVCSGSDREMFKEHLKIDLSLKEEF